MEAPGEPPAALGLAAARSLVQVVCSKGRLLDAQPDHTLRFVSPCAAGPTTLWVLAAVAGRAGATVGTACRYVLSSAAGGSYLSMAGGQLGCTSEPSMLQIYMDMNRGVVLSLGGKACLQAAPSGAAVVGRLPLGRDRASKLFTLLEAGLPLHSLQAWPLRVALRCDAAGSGGAGGYLSAGSSGALSVGAPVACCSEEFLLAPGEAAPLSVDAGKLVAPASSVWAGSGRRLLSKDPLTGQVLLAAQHACSGHERFTLQLSSTGEVRLLAEAPPVATSSSGGGSSSGSGSSSSSRESCGRESCGASGASGGHISRDKLCGGSSSTALLPAVVRQGVLLAAGCESGGGSGNVAGKPTAFALELASSEPALLLTAHGQLLSCPSAASDGARARPAGVLLPAQRAATAGAAAPAAAPGEQPCGPCPAAVQRCAWVLEHHGESVYSLRHALTGQSLYLDDHGAPCLEPPGGRIVYPDERLLFWIEPGWFTLSAAGSAEAGSGSGSPHGGGSSSGSTEGTGHIDAALPSVAGFMQPGLGSSSASSSRGSSGDHGCRRGSSGSSSSSSGGGGGSLTAAGFSIRSVRRVGGRHLYLSALPDGLLTTVHATSRPSRWELFQLADLQSLVESPLGLLGRLPCASAAPAAAAAAPRPQAPLRRAASMQAVGSSALGGLAGSSSAGGASRSSSELVCSPRLPPVAEQEEAGASAMLPAQRGWEAPQPPPAAATPQSAGLLPRRCQSDTALAALEQRQRQQDREEGRGWRRRPLWLAQQLQAPQEPRGWGVCSAASLQDLACRQLCASLAAEYRRQHGGGRLPAGLVEAVETELSTHLPEELSARIGRELRLLLEPPAPTKLSLHRLCKAAAGEPKDVPPWALPHLPTEGDPLGLQWQPTEAFLCARCRGASGPLLPLDPYTNPAHHLFLHAMERTARGGGRVRLRARRRHDEEDLLIRALKAGKLLLLAWAAGRTLGAVLLGGTGASGGGASSRRRA
ncbi:hypothetical protein ABPG75_010859 [Micractinium tetrahymenae]